MITIMEMGTVVQQADVTQSNNKYTLKRIVSFSRSSDILVSYNTSLP